MSLKPSILPFQQHPHFQTFTICKTIFLAQHLFPHSQYVISPVGKLHVFGAAYNKRESKSLQLVCNGKRRKNMGIRTICDKVHAEFELEIDYWLNIYHAL